ncbi:hypothetical protein GCM10009630_46050 [Kribbella jejuensis]|uniref:Uncharacterized protein n=1 Tax=Kribbella jejuensis TaxID=236068 RepID=A0A542EWU7_9ACTN|nr:hypothetical protein [Kribbella jejuensis]TQJ19822.1 hypothetical protein FB475_4000 [Kribbella jejuensis]
MPVDTTKHAQGNDFFVPDPALPPLSRRQADRLVHLALRTTADLGLALTYRGGAALVPVDESADKPLLGLSNLARAAAGIEEDHWPALVEQHFTEVLSQLREGSPPLPADPERELIQRIVPRDALPPDWTIDRADFLPGLIAVPSTDHNGVISMFLDPSDLDLTWSEADRFGLANLRHLEDHAVTVDEDGIRITFINGNGYAASRALVLDTVLRETLHLEPPPYGVLAALPARDTLILHVIEDLSFIPALGLMMRLAARCYSRDPGPLSPDVYLATPALTWHPATISSTDHDPLHLSPQLESLARLLAPREPTHGS